MEVNKAIQWSEPELRFKLGIQERIIDPRVGLAKYGPLDSNTKKRSFSKIRLGLICKDFDEIVGFLEKLNKTFPRQKIGDIPYTGFKSVYKVPIVLPDKNKTTFITREEVDEVRKAKDAFDSIINLYNSKTQQFHDEMRGKYDVVVIQVPKEFTRYEAPGKVVRTFAKIHTIRRQMMSQFITEKALTYRYDCDNMWNLSVALYTKSGGTPWMLKEFSKTKCFIGIAYGIKRIESGQRVLAGLAEVFDEFGAHVTMTSITGEAFGKDYILETDGSYHLSRKKIASLVEKLINEYIRKVGNPPENVVIHKTTFFNPDEKAGINKVMSKHKSSYDLVHLIQNPSQRLFTTQRPPPLRGTFWPMGMDLALLYTTGVVESFGTYPGIGIPKPFEVARDEGATELDILAKQVLALTKMDWNNTTLMNGEPVTTKYASRIVEFLKAGLKAEEIVKDIRYYM